MEAEQQSECRLTADKLVEYAWDYFLAHGQARLATFRFYLIFCTIICAGCFMILANSSRPWMASPLSFLLSFLSFVYWKVDQRHKALIRNAQDALVACETSWRLPDVDGQPHPLRLFSRDAAEKAARRAGEVTSSRFTYSVCVGMVFFVMGVGGFVGGIAVVLWQALK